ncbi:AAA family ATPase [Halalkaliarchaeum sp. AArc-GB]|uniref:AAA family ATPase n=1 Tax=Halalkaliarchaeum sp. AArc-GB TaxID=3074078 RepID=UPI002866BFCA|nr:AAA family ATPase [Halalkaliarchaeum sp. AArc-GB]MDR5674702.1 AAA family ATPase [Halalkaliarchaeum sp. AArc-GB]
MGDPHGSDGRVESSQNGSAQNGLKTDRPPAGGRIIAICGVPGVGKTTTAEWITDNVGDRLLRTDVIRKELFPDPSYTAEERRRTYAELFDRAFDVASAGEVAVLDATFARRHYRDWLRDRADGADVDVEFVEVDCAEPVVRDRIAAREGASDADFEVYLYYRYRFDPVRGEHLTVDNSNGLAETYAQLEQYFGGVGAASADRSAETDRATEFEQPSEAE